MDRQLFVMMAINSALAVTAAIGVLGFVWVLVRHELAWGIILAVLIVLFASYLDARILITGFVYRKKRPGVSTRLLRAGLEIVNIIAAFSAIFIWSFAWIYMHDQFVWAILITAIFLVPVACLNIPFLLQDYAILRKNPGQ